MKKIEDIIDYINSEISDAEKYVHAAHKIRDDDKKLADIYVTLASEELRHVDILHERIVDEIKMYREEYGPPPEIMQHMYNREHERIIDRVVTVKRMLEMYRA